MNGYEHYTKTELMTIAKDKNLKGRSKMNKEELFNALFGDFNLTELEHLKSKMGLSTSAKTLPGLKRRITQELQRRMCSCIKKVKAKGYDESRAIAICRTSVLQGRGVDFEHISCKETSKLKKSPTPRRK